MISVSEFCTCHQIEWSFVQSVYESGLIDLRTVGDETFIPENDVKELETVVHLCNDMDINLEGVEVIRRLIERIDGMHEEIIRLQNRLDFYEK